VEDPLPLCARCTGRRLVGAVGVERQRAAAHAADAAPAADSADTAQAPDADAAPAADVGPGAAKDGGAPTDDGAAKDDVPGVYVDEPDCAVCEGAFADANRWLAAALAALDGFEATTFQVGTMFPAACEKVERDLAARMPSVPGRDAMTDSIRTEANRWLGPRIATATGMQWVTDGRPELVVTADTRFWTADVTANSLFVAGRYTKHRRDIPQTHWPCKRCQGLGCWECDDTGVMYAESVEDAIGAAVTPVFGGSGHSFHGAGREDIDALMLGSGRPFVLEVHGPRRRTVDLDAVSAAINAATATSGVGVSGLRAAEKEEVARIKAADYDKEYLAHCVAAGSVTTAAVAAAARAMTGTTLDQRTPDRVSHRRADLVRKRTVHAVTVEAPPELQSPVASPVAAPVASPVAPPAASSVAQREDTAAHARFAIRVRAESGTYIKEMVSGDDGRTTPSFASLLGVACRVESLDVVAILDGDAATPGDDRRKVVEP
jgi:tRNA pseudouridine synthase 10